MNLKLSETVSDAFAKITFDTNVILDVELTPESEGSSLFFKVEPDKQTVLEFFLDFPSGLLREFILYTLPRRRVKILPVDAEGPTVPTKGRRPAFSLDAWPSDIASTIASTDWNRRFVAVQDDFELVIGPASVSIRFAGKKGPASWIVNTRVRFGLDDSGQLSRIDLFNLKADEVGLLKEAVSHKP